MRAKPAKRSRGKRSSFKELDYDGEVALRKVLQTSIYGSLEQAIASLTLFSHPKTVAQTKCAGIFRVRRLGNGEKRGDIDQENEVVLCDNTTPTDVFLWANGLSRKKYFQVQFNHIYENSEDWNCYTSLANICVTPAFLSKATDKTESVKEILRYRVYELYGYIHKAATAPTKPKRYDALSWASCLEERKGIDEVFRKKLKRCTRSRAAISAEKFGWHFGPLKIKKPRAKP